MSSAAAAAVAPQKTKGMSKGNPNPIWITIRLSGASGGGKSTCAALIAKICKLLGYNLKLIDGEHLVLNNSLKDTYKGEIQANKKESFDGVDFVFFFDTKCEFVEARIQDAIGRSNRVAGIVAKLLESAKKEFTRKLPTMLAKLKELGIPNQTVNGPLYDCLQQMVKTILAKFGDKLPDSAKINQPQIDAAIIEAMKAFRFQCQLSGWFACGSPLISEQLVKRFPLPENTQMDYKTCLQVIKDGKTVYITSSEIDPALLDCRLTVIGLQVAENEPGALVQILSKISVDLEKKGVPFVSKHFPGAKIAIFNPKNSEKLKRLPNYDVLATHTKSFLKDGPTLREFLEKEPFVFKTEPLPLIEVCLVDDSPDGVLVWVNHGDDKHTSYFTGNEIRLLSNVGLPLHETKSALTAPIKEQDVATAAAAASEPESPPRVEPKMTVAANAVASIASTD